jgi:hypothetical protein
LNYGIDDEHVPLLQTRRPAKINLSPVMPAKLNVSDYRAYEMANHWAGDPPDQIRRKNKCAIEHYHDIQGSIPIVSGYRSP